jgi:SHS2 domain-containing protein
MPWQEIEHTADWALRVWAPTPQALFVEAARGMYALLAPGPIPTEVTLHLKPLVLMAVDAEALLVAWLQEQLYFTESENLLFVDFALANWAPMHLRGEAWGYTALQRNKVIKAVTYHNLQIHPTMNGVETTLVFDV